MGKRKMYYAVTNGRNIGVYTSFGLVQKQVMGFRGGTQRGYPTLEEALKDMQINGHNNPPIYDHNEENIADHRQTENVVTSVSDSALNVDVYYDANLPDENMRVLEIEHPERGLDIDQLFVRASQSDHDLATNVQSSNHVMDDSDNISLNFDRQTLAQCEQTLVKEMISQSFDQQSPSEYDQTYTKEIICHDTVQYSCKETQTCSMATQNDNDNNNLLQSLFNMISSLNDKIECLQNKVNDQTKINQELVETLHNQIEKQEIIHNVYNNRLQHMEGLITKLEPKEDSNIIRVQEIETKCDKLYEKQADILEAICTQKLGHDKKLDDLKALCILSQNLSVEKNDKVAETCQDIGKQTNFEPNDENKSKDISQTPSYPESQDESNQDKDVETFPSVEKNIDELSEDEDSEVSIIHHHTRLTGQNLNENSSDKFKYKFHLSDEKCKNVLLGDSNMKTINRVRLDKTKQTEIRTYRGATIQSLANIIDSSDSTYPHVENVYLCIGSVDCGRRFIDENKIISDYENLLVKIRNVFPAAKIAISAIPPQRNRYTNKYIWKVNLSLKSLAKEKNVSFSSCSGLWMHVNKTGEVDDGLLVDNIHLSPRGIGLLLRPIINFFFGQRRQDAPRMENMSKNYVETRKSEDESAQPSSQESSNTSLDRNSSKKSLSTRNINIAQGTEFSQTDYAQQMKNFSDNLAQLLSSGIMTFTNHVQSLTIKS